MDIKQKLETSLHEAMRSSNEAAKRSIRMILSAIKLAETEKGKPLDEAAILSIIQKEIKNCQEVIGEAQKTGRDDIIQENRADIAVLESFLPKQLSDSEIEELAKGVILEVGAKGKEDMGKVMKVLIPKLQGRAPGDKVSQIVKRYLEGSVQD
ncbi:MAG: GatB/YqeY domain-containing protein [Anaerolineae bacterium]|nr:GatB/YqeY domain-containing protein [Anaerolineae bacterium]